MAEFYGYFLNSVIVTVGTLVVSISIGCLGGYGLARYSGILGVVILVAALAFRALPRMAFVLALLFPGPDVGSVRHVPAADPDAGGGEPAFHHLDAAQLLHGDPTRDRGSRDDGRRGPAAVVPPGDRADHAGRALSPRACSPCCWRTTSSCWRASSPSPNGRCPWRLPHYTSGEDASHLTMAAAGSVSITLPIIFVIIVFQKYLVKGLASGAVKG